MVADGGGSPVGEGVVVCIALEVDVEPTSRGDTGFRFSARDERGSRQDITAEGGTVGEEEAGSRSFGRPQEVGEMRSAQV